MQTSTKSLLVLLIGVTCILQTTAQVCPYNSTLCTCIRHAVSCDRLESIPSLTIGYNQSWFTDLEFKGGNITTILNNSLPNGIELLELTGHPLTNISDDAFDNLATTLDVLYIKGAKFTELPRALLKLRVLDELHIYDTPIQHWENSILQYLPTTLHFLLLGNVGLPFWPSWISNFPLLLTLYLSKNPLKSIPDNAFSAFNGSLRHLHLESTGLTGIPQSLLNLPNLTELDLRGNKFLDLSENLNFSNLKSLKTVKLDNNNITYYTAGSLPPGVVTLSLSINRFSSVQAVVASLSYLKQLNLSRNEISKIPEDSFPSSLSNLDLSYNKLIDITTTTFAKLNLLTTLDLSNNPISTVSPWAFSDTKSIEVLSFIYTNLTEIPLAVTKLSSFALKIYFKNISSLDCPLPISTELSKWYNGLYFSTILGDCKDGQTIDQYLQSAPATTTTIIPTTTHGHAPGLEFNFLCSYVSLLLPLLFWF